MKQRVVDPSQINLAIFLIGWMSLLLAAAFQFLKLIERMEASLQSFLISDRLNAPTNALHPIIVWSATALLGFLIPALILHMPNLIHRFLTWLLFLLLTLSWAPVLLLASYHPSIGVSSIVVFWAGLCSLIYSQIYSIPADQNSLHSSSSPIHGPR